MYQRPSRSTSATASLITLLAVLTSLLIEPSDSTLPAIFSKFSFVPDCGHGFYDSIAGDGQRNDTVAGIVPLTDYDAVLHAGGAHQQHQQQQQQQQHEQQHRQSTIDCFGIGGKFARGLDWFLRNEANGSAALRVQFHLATRRYAERVLFKAGLNLVEEHGRKFDPRKRTVVIVHGFMAHGDVKWIGGMVEAFLKWGDVNVLVVDWSGGSNVWNYYKAAVNTRTVGDEIATALCTLAKAKSANGRFDFGKLHLIGHSLGSHICGYAAWELRRRGCPWLPARITGLDPAHPCFNNPDKTLRLDASDAPLVDVIHTNGRGLLKLGLGLPNPVGHIDFYPNGGKLQPGCKISRTFIQKFLPLPINTIRETICSHGRSYLYFIDSLSSSVSHECTFWAHRWNLTYEDFDTSWDSKCDKGGCIEMGINAEKYNTTGTFLTLTGNSRPFCKIDEETKKEVRHIVDKVKAMCKTTNVESANEYRFVLT